MEPDVIGLAPGPFGRQRKFEWLCTQLRAMAERMEPDAKLPTMVQLRDALGVSTATLSSALDALEAGYVIYRRHGVGIYVSPRLRRKTICLVCDPGLLSGGGSSPFWDLLVEQARRRAAAHDEAFSFHLGRPHGHPGAPLQDGLMADIQAGRVDGLLCVGLDRATADWLDAQKIPTVVFAGASRWMVNLDGEEGIRLGVRELAAQGARDLALWHHTAPPRPDDPPPSEDKEIREMFRQALAEHGLPYDPARIVDNREHPSLTKQEQGYQTAMDVFGQEGTKPDGIYIGDDLMTQGALTALKNLGIRPGRDARIATHANVGSPVLLGQEDALTLIEIDPEEVTGEIFRMLETLMDNKTPVQPSVLVKPRVKR